MVYENFIEVGRVAVVNFGANADRIAVIIDVVDTEHCLVDAPTTIKNGVDRQVISTKRLTLTEVVAAVPRNARTGTLNKAFKDQGVEAKFNESKVAVRIAKQQKKKSMNDFDRFKVMVAKKAAKAK